MSRTDGNPVDGRGVAVERRRPGRREVSPGLIPLLRNPAGDGTVPGGGLPRPGEAPALMAGQDALEAARGIAMGVALSAPLWGVVAAIGLVLRR